MSRGSGADSARRRIVQYSRLRSIGPRAPQGAIRLAFVSSLAVARGPERWRFRCRAMVDRSTTVPDAVDGVETGWADAHVRRDFSSRSSYGHEVLVTSTAQRRTGNSFPSHVAECRYWTDSRSVWRVNTRHPRRAGHTAITCKDQQNWLPTREHGAVFVLVANRSPLEWLQKVVTLSWSASLARGPSSRIEVHGVVRTISPSRLRIVRRPSSHVGYVDDPGISEQREPDRYSRVRLGLGRHTGKWKRH